MTKNTCIKYVFQIYLSNFTCYSLAKIYIVRIYLNYVQVKETHFKVHPEWKWCSKERRKSAGGTRKCRRQTASVSEAISGDSHLSHDGKYI